MSTVRLGDFWFGTYLGIPVAGVVCKIVDGTVYDREKVRLHIVMPRPIQAFGQEFERCLVEVRNERAP